MSGHEVIAGILNRLTVLEKSVQAKTEEVQLLQEQRTKMEGNVFSLQKENFDLKKELFNYQKEKVELKENFDVLESRVSAIEGSTRDVPNIRQDVVNLTLQNTKLVGLLLPKMDIVDTKLSALSREIPPLREARERQRCQNEAVSRDLETVINKVGMLETTVSQLTCLQKVLNRILVGTHGTVKPKVEELNRRTNRLENRLYSFSQSLSRTLAAPKGSLPTAEWVKLDHLTDTLGGLLNQSNGCLEPKCDGGYFVGVRFVQGGDGEIGVWLNWDGSETRREYLGKTEKGGDDKSDQENQRLHDMINADRRIHLVPAYILGKYTLRFAICASRTQRADVDYAWDVIKDITEKLLTG